MDEHAELTITEAVRYSGFTRTYIYILIQQNNIKARKINTRSFPIYVIDRHSLDLYMKTSRKYNKRAVKDVASV